MTNDEIESLRKNMESLPTWPELGYLKTDHLFTLEFLRKRSLSPEDKKRALELVNDVKELNTQSNTKETIVKMSDKLMDILEIILTEKTD